MPNTFNISELIVEDFWFWSEIHICPLGKIILGYRNMPVNVGGHRYFQDVYCHHLPWFPNRLVCKFCSALGAQYRTSTYDNPYTLCQIHPICLTPQLFKCLFGKIDTSLHGSHDTKEEPFRLHRQVYVVVPSTYCMHPINHDQLRSQLSIPSPQVPFGHFSVVHRACNNLCVTLSFCYARWFAKILYPCHCY